LHYDLELKYSVNSNRLDGRAVVTISPTKPLRRIAFDLAGLRVTKASVSGQPVRWQQRADKLTIESPTPLPPGRIVDIGIRYQGHPGPTPSVWGPVGWEELTDGVLVASQPSGASTWFPCNDLARQKATFRVRVATSSAYYVVVNGRLRSRRSNGSTTTWEYDQSEPTSPYLMAVNIGRYTESSFAGTPTPIGAVFDPLTRDAFMGAFERLPEMMDVFIDRFGPYPFEAPFTVVLCPEPLEIPIEAQGQAMFGTNHLDEQSHRLIPHELAHQWFGNSVTASTWRDVWLHEGFACYAEWIWSEASGGPSADDLARMHHRRLSALPQDLIVGDPGAADMFDDRVYKRGALALHALRAEVGDPKFFALLQRWTSTYQHSIVCSRDFELMADQAAGVSLEPLFTAWLRQPELPVL
jgi:aminopeptidase N